ncbi:MAG: hypothetical protein M3N93_10130, partial [Acidobacteriota bacterium]|nr:hypothetical protein [Acidobacteriota bacterium]
QFMVFRLGSGMTRLNNGRRAHGVLRHADEMLQTRMPGVDGPPSLVSFVRKLVAPEVVAVAI